ncbi:MAG: ABC transporter ATP-binding protein [Anaerolineae bacterium]
MSSKKSSVFGRFLRQYIAPQAFLLVAASIGGIVKFALPLFVPQVTRHLIDNVYLNDTLAQSEKNEQLVVLVGGLIAAFIFIWLPMVYIRHQFAARAAQRATYEIRLDLYYHILRLSTSFFDNFKSGAVVTRIMSDVDQAQNLIGNALTSIWMDLVAVFLTLYFLFQINVTLALIALSTFPFYLYFFKRMQTRVKISSQKVQEGMESMTGHVQERIAGNRVIHAFTGEMFERDLFTNESRRLYARSLNRARLQSTNIAISGVITQIAPLLIILVGGYMVIQGELSVGELVAVGLYLAPLYTPFERFADLNVVFANATAALERIFEMMDMETDVHEAEDAPEMGSVKGDVRLENVSFRYPLGDKGTTVLRNISLEVKAGERVALVGPSGSGKTTILSLLPRFYEVQTGRITIDGVDIRDVTLQSLRSQIGLVLQSPILFSGSVRNNICYAKPDATEEELIEACIAANAYNFIQALPHKFETEVGESGIFLSGGQRQRLTLARAFLKNPKILLLDEATSALDTESERLIQQALDKLMENRTTFIVAHRLSTIVNCDHIFVLQGGQIVQSGSHQELVTMPGLYAALYGQRVEGCKTIAI